VAHSLRFSSSGFLLLGLALTGPACVGFISDDAATTGDADTTGDGDGDPGDGDGDPAGDTTIYALQQGMVGDGMIVSVRGVVVTTPINVEDGLAFVEEPDAGQYSGISLYLWDEVVMATTLQPGDVVDITGEYAEFYEASQLIVQNPGDITVVGTAAVPGPDAVTAADVARTSPDAEPWEGVRVCIDGAALLESNDGFGQYVLVGDALVGNSFVDPLPDAQIGGTFAQVCGSLDYSFNEFKLQPASPDDLGSYTTPVPQDSTIPAIQQGMVPRGTFVTLTDVVATSGLTWSDTTEAEFFVQDPAGGPFSGIQVFVNDSAAVQVAPGDQVTLTGTYDEFHDMSQIVVGDASLIMVGSNGPAPAPELIDPAMIANDGALSEDYEGVLMVVENVMVTNPMPDAPEEFGDFEITGGLRVGDMFFAIDDWNKPAMGQGYASITGPLVYDFDNFKLAPRDAADLVEN
jgi:DNA/RNA endonuclease YhcR with UshA esterase domain